MERVSAISKQQAEKVISSKDKYRLIAEVTASMEEQTASIQEIAASAEGMSDLAKNLNTIIARFKV
ncbi:MAG: hypothetical protein AB7E31_05895 [Desulfitobacterium sp.]